jgi:hypothetical protein
MILFAVTASAAPPPDLDAASRAFADLLGAMNGPAPVTVGGEPLAGFVPELDVLAGPADAVERLARDPFRRCYAAALARRPAWLVVVDLAVLVPPTGAPSARIATNPARGLEAGWAPDPTFDGCLTDAVARWEVGRGAALQEWTLRATFRPVTEVIVVPEGAGVIGIGP